MSASAAEHLQQMLIVAAVCRTPPAAAPHLCLLYPEYDKSLAISS
jgi:hypothetical protein